MKNTAILIGHLGADPEMNTFESGTKKTTFSLATSETYKKNGEKKTVTEWHNVVMWKRLAEIAYEYLKKGSLIYIEGQIKYRKYEKDGATKYVTEIEARQMTMLGGKEKTGITNDIPDLGEGDKDGDDMPF